MPFGQDVSSKLRESTSQKGGAWRYIQKISTIHGRGQRFATFGPEAMVRPRQADREQVTSQNLPQALQCIVNLASL
jgi:hypothetical protein